MSGEILNAMARLGGQHGSMGALPADDWDDEWSDPIPAGVLHANPNDGRLPCCGRNASSVRPGEGWTSDPDAVECGRATS